MYDLINAGGHTCDDIWTEQGTQAEAYSIDKDPLFDMSTAPAMAMHDDAHDDEDTEDNADADLDAEVEGIVMAGTITATQKRFLQEDRMLHHQGGRVSLSVLACN
jgi:hypothetical protein